MNRTRTIFWLGLLAVVLLFIALAVLFGIYADWLWFRNLGFSSVFWTILLTKIEAALAFGLLFLVIIGLSLYFVRRYVGGPDIELVVTGEEAQNRHRPSSVGYLVLALLFALITGLIGMSRWDMILRYFHQQPFGVADPIFGRDIGFYVFSLPFHFFLTKWLLGSLLIVAIATTWAYVIGGAIRSDGSQLAFVPRAMAHLSVLGGAILLLIAWLYRLKIFGLLYSSRGVAFGANYTDVHVQQWAYWIMVIVSILSAGLFFANLFFRRLKLPVAGFGLLLGGIILISTLPAAFTQWLVVRPSELAKETPFIRRNIDYTRRAYNLDKTEEKEFAATEELTQRDIEENDLTIRNIRIWDERPLMQTYSQIQEIRLYYDFEGVDVDRYLVEDGYRQVMLSARELSEAQLPQQARTWVNRHLKYTHGYGLALSPVNQVTEEGLPQLLVKDLPPITPPSLRIRRPEIYYGEKTSNYVIVRTKEPEFDYPKGDKGVYTNYQGTGGVSISSFFRRLAFTFKFRDLKILLTDSITPESRVMFNRTVDQRRQTVAPFLRYDRDPYLVISEGKIYWIQDAYTATNMYPYSERLRGRGININYIRNSVKVVIDAYKGDMSFYVVDEADPIIQVYMRIFPELFKPFDQMSSALKAHIRYPKDLFRIQAYMYRSYHMQDVQVFYNREDMWEIPNEVYSDNTQPLEPYYIIIRLPGQRREEFLLMLPFTPSRKDNMIAWLAARNDLPHYGQLLVYKLPKEKLIFGPMQIEARIDQQPEISSQLTLWGQRGSRVIRGNLLAIPINESFLYVEPVYLEARQEQAPPMGQQFGPESEEFSRGQRRARVPIRRPAVAALPELKQVIVAFGNRLAMRDNLESALEAIFGGRVEVAEERRPFQPPVPTEAATVRDLASSAIEHYAAARKHLTEWDWSEFGAELDKLERVLRDLNEAVGQEE